MKSKKDKSSFYSYDVKLYSLLVCIISWRVKLNTLCSKHIRGVNVKLVLESRLLRMKHLSIV